MKIVVISPSSGVTKRCEIGASRHKQEREQETAEGTHTGGKRRPEDMVHEFCALACAPHI